MRSIVALAVIGAAMLVNRSAWATYSIVAVDPATGTVGAAGASCVPYEVIRIYGVAPGGGAVVAQANFDDDALAEAVARLAAHEDAADVLAAVTDAALHPQAPKMQWGMVDARGGAVTATGPLAMPWAGGSELEAGALRAVAQGNIMTSSAVVDQALAGFARDGCDLADRLVVALEAGPESGEGDSRCTPDGIPAKSAFLDVTSPEGTVVRISVPDVSPADPLAALRVEYDAWRVEHACPAAQGTQSSTAPDEEAASCATVSAGAPRSMGSSALLVLAAWLAARRRRTRRRRGCDIRRACAPPLRFPP